MRSIRPPPTARSGSGTWPPASEERQVVEHGFGINEIVLGPDAGWLAWGAVDGTAVIEPASGAEIADLSAERRPILALDLSRGGGRLAVGDGEGTS